MPPTPDALAEAERLARSEHMRALVNIRWARHRQRQAEAPSPPQAVVIFREAGKPALVREFAPDSIAMMRALRMILDDGT